MATGKTFFSYSRTDSAFVLKLAKDLRDAGVVLWLDQLDIKGGSHWDSAIEKALNSAASLIVVLSKESVKSNNVMDEVSFALESGKTVIPVLLEECVVPFRLRRLQRIDFTGDYQTGFNQLLEVLRNTIVPDTSTSSTSSEAEIETASKDTSVSSFGETTTAFKTNPVNPGTDRYETKPSGTQNDDGLVQSETKALPYKKYLLIGAIAIIIGVVVWKVIPKGSDKPEDVTTGNADSIENAGATESSNTAAGTTVPDDLDIGEVFQGGYVFYIDSLGEHGLIAAAKDFDVQSEATDGAVFCKELKEEIANYKAGGYTDWRLPTIEELRLLYESRKILPAFQLTSDPDEIERVGHYATAPYDTNCGAVTKAFETGTEEEVEIHRGKNFRLVRPF